MRAVPRALSASVVLLMGCGTSSSSPADAGTPDAGDPNATELGGERPVEMHVPSGYVAGVETPLVVLLHGYGASGGIQDLYFGLTAASDRRGFLYAHPDGLVDLDGKRYWNATDACCGVGTKVDDSQYLSSLITQIQARYTVDPKRIFLIGHSNGGFMSYRMACDHSEQIAAIASLAGAMFADVTKCTPKTAVSILQIHGTADAVILYDGGQVEGNPGYPSAKATVSAWATLDGCSLTADTSTRPLDLDSKLAGDESIVTKYGTGCKPGGHAELWTIQGGAHIPSISTSFTASVIDFLFAHPKP